jgi:hypothetical protein
MSPLAPWAGWIAGILGWIASDQLGSDLVQLDCTRADLAPMLAIGIIGAAVAILGGLVSLRAWRRPGQAQPVSVGARRLIAGTGTLAAGIFLLAILFQTTASFIIPQCHA